jgi:hypothetical protein
MNLFIDTNIYLSFYHFTSDDLDELRKLAVIMAEKKVTLYVPDQVLDEFQRNREATISQAMKHLKSQKLNLEFPQLCKDYAEYEKLRDCQVHYDKVHSELIRKLSVDIAAKTLKADKTINILFEQASKIPISPELIEKARIRVETGRPPGKKGSLGDAINWESLLSAVKSKDIFFVSDDSDYCSAIDDSNFNQYLENEWKQAKVTNLHFFKKLSQFFKDTLPDIKLSDDFAGELEKEILIKRLAVSSSFAQTHLILSKLRNHSGFTAEQLNAILEAYVYNDQISRILSDSDVRSFVEEIVFNHREVLNPENLTKIAILIHAAESSPKVDYDDLEPPPF